MKIANEVLDMLEVSTNDFFKEMELVWKKSKVSKIQRFLRSAPPHHLEALEKQVLAVVKSRSKVSWEDLENIITTRFIDGWLKKYD